MKKNMLFSSGSNNELVLLESPGQFFSRVFRRIPRHTLFTFAIAFVICFLVHGFMLANKLPNHDDISHLFGSDYGAASGRWLLPILLHMDGEISAPWLIGVISALFLAASVCLAAAVLRIRSPLSSVLLAALMISFPAVGSTFTYMFSAGAYFFSVMLACLAAYLTVKYRFGFIGGTLATALSLSIYQGYLGLTAALLVTALIFEVLDGADFRRSVFRALTFLGTLVLGLLIYYITVKLTTRTDALVDYMGISEMGRVSVSDLPRLISLAYKSYYYLYISDVRNVYFSFMAFAFLALVLGSAGLMLVLLRNKKLKLIQILVLVLLFLALPLAGALIYIMVPNAEAHGLMVYGLIAFLTTPLALYEYRTTVSDSGSATLLSSVACWLIILPLILTAYNHTIHTNEAYMKMSLSYEQAMSYSTRLFGAIEGFEDYDENTPVVLVGKAMTTVEFPPTPKLKEIYMTGAIDAESFINSYSSGIYLRFYLGVSNIIFDSESIRAKEFSQNPDVEAMPTYPHKDSIALIDGYIVVKLGDRD